MIVRHRAAPLAGLLVLPLLATAGVAPPACRAAVVLSEILADPATDWNGDGAINSRDDEWVEVTNTGPDAVDLSAYFLRDALGTEAHLQLSGTLGSGQARVFFGSDAAAWQATQGITVTGLSLNNTGDTVELWRGMPGQTGSQLDDVDIFADHEAEDDRSSGRLTDGTWVIFDALNPYTGTLLPGGSGCAPSPGAVNVCRPNVPLEAATWGALKGEYR